MKAIELDDELVAETVRATGGKSEREAIEAALRQQLQFEDQKRALRELWGSFDWQGNLEESRLSRTGIGMLSSSGKDLPLLSASGRVVEEVLIGRDRSEQTETFNSVLTDDHR